MLYDTEKSKQIRDFSNLRRPGEFQIDTQGNPIIPGAVPKDEVEKYVENTQCPAIRFVEGPFLSRPKGLS